MRSEPWVKELLQRLGIGDAMRPRWSYPPKRTTQLYYETFHTSPRLDALYLLASDVASAPFKLYDKKQAKFDADNADPIIDHAIYDVLENPMPKHPELDYFVLMFLTLVYRELVGEAFWVLERDARTVPREIYPIPPNWILSTPTVARPTYMIVPLGNTSHQPLNVAAADVVWFKDPDITSPFGRGRARTEAIGDELESDEYAAKYAKNFFYNDATPSLVIEAPGATKDTAEQFQESWIQKVGGFLNRRKPMVVPWKDAKITKLSDSVREMDFVESRRFLRDVCNQHWAMPPELAGILENSNRSTIDSAYYLWTKNVVTKKLARLESTLNRQFVPLYDKNLVIKFDNVVPADDEYALKVATSGLGAGAITINEWRAANGMKPDEKNGDVYLRSFSMVEVPVVGDAESTDGSAPSASTNVQETALNGAQISSLLQIAMSVVTGELTREAARAIAAAAFPMMGPEELEAIFGALVAQAQGDTGPAALPVKRYKSFAADRRAAIWKAFDAKATRSEPGFSRAVKAIAKDQRREFKAAIEGATGSVEDAVTRALDKVFGSAGNKAVRDTMAPAWRETLRGGAEHALEVLGRSAKAFAKEADSGIVGGTWDIVNPLFESWIKVNGLTRAEGINSTTNDSLRRKIASSLAEGINGGETRTDLTKRVLDATEDVYDEMDSARAKLIARTETTATVNYGQMTTYKAEGVGKKEWLASQDERVRETHDDANGQVVGIDEDFSIGGDTMSAPGLGSDASENCNCRCTILPVIEE